MIRPPMAAWIATSNICRGISWRIFAASARPRSYAMSRWTITDSASTGRSHAVQHARRGRHQVHVEVALEPLLDGLHVQQAEEAAAEPEAERRRRVGLVEERGVVQPQLLERVAQLRILVPFDRIQP